MDILIKITLLLIGTDDDDNEEDDKITLLHIPKITGWEQVSEWVRRLRAVCEDPPPHRSS